MKRSILFIVLFIVATFALSSCVPLPQERLPACQELYANLLGEYPDYPQAFVGFCVASLATGKPTAYQGMCGYEVVWESIAAEGGPTLTSRQECMEYFALQE